MVERVIDKRFCRIVTLIKCNLTLCMRAEQLMLFLSSEG